MQNSIGPYGDASEAEAALSELIRGSVGEENPALASSIILADAVVKSGVATTSYEESALREAAQTITPATAQVLAGLIMRAVARPEN